MDIETVVMVMVMEMEMEMEMETIDRDCGRLASQAAHYCRPKFEGIRTHTHTYTYLHTHTHTHTHTHKFCIHRQALDIITNGNTFHSFTERTFYWIER